jgi:hypothetical protein
MKKCIGFAGVLAGILEQTPEGIVIPEVLSVLWV